MPFIQEAKSSTQNSINDKKSYWVTPLSNRQGVGFRMIQLQSQRLYQRVPCHPLLYPTIHKESFHLGVAPDLTSEWPSLLLRSNIFLILSSRRNKTLFPPFISFHFWKQPVNFYKLTAWIRSRPMTESIMIPGNGIFLGLSLREGNDLSPQWKSW